MNSMSYFDNEFSICGIMHWNIKKMEKISKFDIGPNV